MNSSGFVHSVRVPRLYKAAARTVSSSANGSSVKHHLYEQRLHPNKGAVFALVAETIKHESQLSDLFEKTDLFNQAPRLDPWLARVLFTELIWRKKTLSSDSKPIQTVLEHYEKHKDLCDSLGCIPEDNNVQKVAKPRYVRVNTLKLSTADAVRSFQDEGWNLIRCTSGSYDDYLKQLQNLGESDFIPDYHIKVVFAFPPKTQFHNSQAYLESEIFLQDKATCLAPHFLAPTPGSTILDMCAAPGMKTTHLAALIKNEGTIYAVEQDEKRFETLSQFVESAGATCVKLFNKDVATLTKSDCPSVDYILLDPSCSGSGIDRFGSNDSNYDLESGRLKKLSSFQAKLLRHALNEFNMAKRIVYSTCSLYPQENEEVIKDVLQNHRGKFRLVSAKEKLNNKWNNVGDFNYVDIGEKCIYARPNSDLTIGFFVAVLEQVDTNDLEDDVSIKKKKKLKIVEDSVAADCNDTDILPKKKSKNNNAVEICDFDENVSLDVQNYNVDEYDESQHVHNEKSKKKKKSKKNKDLVDFEIETEKYQNNDSKIEENNVENPEPKKKKKKKKMDASLENISVVPQKEDKDKKTKTKKQLENNSDQLIDIEKESDNVSDSKTDKKKHKKRKNKNEPEGSESIESCTVKISKKRRLESENNNFNESKPIDESSNLSVKKKKKK